MTGIWKPHDLRGQNLYDIRYDFYNHEAAFGVSGRKIQPNMDKFDAEYSSLEACWGYGFIHGFGELPVNTLKLMRDMKDWDEYQQRILMRFFEEGKLKGARLRKKLLKQFKVKEEDLDVNKYISRTMKSW